MTQVAATDGSYFIRPCTTGFGLYCADTGEFVPIDANPKKVIKEDDEFIVLDLSNGSKEYCDDLVENAIFITANGKTYVGGKGTTRWVDDLLEVFNMDKQTMRLQSAPIDFMIQEFALGIDAAHKFWMISNFQDFITVRDYRDSLLLLVSSFLM